MFVTLHILLNTTNQLSNKHSYFKYPYHTVKIYTYLQKNFHELWKFFCLFFVVFLLNFFHILKQTA